MKIVPKQQWANRLSAAGDEKGFFTHLSDEHSALFVEGNGTLVVTFDNLDDARQGGDGRLPWGTEFVSSQGWSSLGLMAHGWTWYRDPAVFDFFDRLRDEDFFKRFDRVVFYGTSMGGYAATSFCAAAPGARVLAMNPQATLDRDLTTGWEHRFVKAWRRDFKGRYAYGPEGVQSAEEVFLFYDPLILADAMHATLYRSDNVTHIRCPRLGHGLTSMLNRMKLLKPIVQHCVDGTLDMAEIYTLLRARRMMPFYQKMILTELLESGNPWRIHQYTKAVLDRSEGASRPHFRRAMARAEAQMNRARRS